MGTSKTRKGKQEGGAKGARPFRVIVVDDHPIVRRGIVELISQETDLEVVADVGSVREAMADIERFHPDIAIVDVALEQSNGIELTRQVRAQYGDLKVLMLSMHEEALYAERALKAGANGYVMKVEAPEALLGAIREVLRDGLYVSQRIATKLLRGYIENGDDPLVRGGIESLSDRELEIFELIGKGLTTREVAARLSLSVKTIETHRAHIKSKLRLKNGAELTQNAVSWVTSSTGI